MAYRFDRLTTSCIVTSHGGMQEMAWQLKGKIAKCERREYGFAQIHVNKTGNGADVLFEGLGDELEVSGKVGAS
jgi:GMP synthase-like glutamine amidotransferase